MKRLLLDDDAFECVGSPLLGSRQDSSAWAGLDSLGSPRLLTDKAEDVDDLLLSQFLDLKEDSPSMDEVEEAIDQADSTTEPPRFALDYESSIESQNTYFSIVKQPPREVRTRKKKEKRPFSVQVLVKSPPNDIGVESCPVVTCRLVFADDFTSVPEESECFQTATVSTLNQVLVFENLGIVNPCLKWKDREYALEFEFDGFPCSKLRTRKIYGFSNMGVLQRRREVSIVALSAKRIGLHGGQKMHLVGKTFFKSDRLRVVFRVFNGKSKRWVTLEAGNLDCYTESVLFFDAPKVPLQLLLETCNSHGEMQAFVQVTNDGTNYSNGLEVILKSSTGTTTSSMMSKRPRSDEELQQARL